MAISLQYKISGTADTAALKKTELAISKTTKAVKNMNKAVAAFAIAKTIQGITKVTNGSTEAFLKQNKALQQYNAVLKLTNNSLQKYNAIRKQASHNNLFDDNSLNDALKYCAQLGLTEEQTKKVMKASTDMAASGIMPLDTAVKQLSLTYSGNLGQLKKIQPELASLTKEQLANGDAIDIVAKKYSGMANAMALSFDGRNTQWKNSFSDLQASVGSVFQKVKYQWQGDLLDPINKITNWFNENSTKISAWIAAIPQNMKIAGKAILDIFKEIWSEEFWSKNAGYIGEILIKVFDSVTSTITDLFLLAFENIKIIAENIGPAIGSGIMLGIKNGLGSIGQAILELTLGNALGMDSKAFANAWNGIQEWRESGNNNWKSDFNKGRVNASKEIASNYVSTFKSIGSSLAKDGKYISTLLGKIDTNITDTVGKAARDINNNVTENMSEIELGATAGENIVVVSNSDSKSSISPVYSKPEVTGKSLWSSISDWFKQINKNREGSDKIRDLYNSLNPQFEKIATELHYIYAQRRNARRMYNRTADEAEGYLYGAGVPRNRTRFYELANRVTNLDITDNNLHDQSAILEMQLRQMQGVYDAEKQKIYDEYNMDQEYLDKIWADIKKGISNIGDTVADGIGNFITAVSSTVLNNMGQTGNYIQAGITGAETGGAYGAFLAIFTQFAADFMAKAEEISDKVSLAYNLVNAILDQIANNFIATFETFLDPFIAIFAPLKDIFSSFLGLFSASLLNMANKLTLIAQIINILAPAITGILDTISLVGSSVAAIVKLFNEVNPVWFAIKGVVAGVSTVITTIAVFINNAFIDVYNWLVDIGNMLYSYFHWGEYGNFQHTAIQKKDLATEVGKIWEADSTSRTAEIKTALEYAASSTGSSASYTAARDIYVTINYDHSYVNGDASEIALNLYEELKNQKKLGLID